MGLKRWKYKGKLEAGCDEAGRGCLAGPVVAAAVILNPQKRINSLNDSKILHENQRNELRIQIEQKALSWSVCAVPPKEIDEINILRASFVAMHRAISRLETCPEVLLIDGNRFHPYAEIYHECIIKGDGKFQSIAAASILAKTHRDELMTNLHNDFPHYDWRSNKGYPTRHHRNAILEFGPTPHHRKSFKLFAEQLKLFI